MTDNGNETQKKSSSISNLFQESHLQFTQGMDRDGDEVNGDSDNDDEL